MDRRTYLVGVATATATVALAGCSEEEDGEEEDGEDGEDGEDEEEEGGEEEDGGAY